MNYVIKLMGGEKITITNEEFKNLTGKSGLVFIPSKAGFVNISSISCVLPIDNPALRANLKEGRLSDGTRVIKRGGEWRLAHCPDVKPDPNYYPEIAKDEVLSEEEYQADKNKKQLTGGRTLCQTNNNQST